MNPFSAKAFEFKPSGAIDLGDGGAPAFGDFTAPKKKKQDAASLQAEAKKKKDDEMAKLPTKGKPSDFFIMDYQEGDESDPTGGCRIPTMDQKMFIFSNYPTCAQLPAMIGKVYELYFLAKDIEEKEAAKKAYGKPEHRKGYGGPDASSEEEDTNYGKPMKQTKKNPAGI